MKRLVVLLAGLSLIGGTVFAEENKKSDFSWDFKKTELEFRHDLHNQNKGTFYTEKDDYEVDLHLNLRKNNTTMGIEAEFDDGAGEDNLYFTLNQKIFDRLEVQVKGQLNFGAASGGFKATEDDDVFVKYTPENIQNLEIGFYPFDIDMTIGDELELEYKGVEHGSPDIVDEVAIPGIRFNYKASENSTIKLGLGSRQNAKSSEDLKKKENVYHIHAAYAYEGEKFNLEAAGVFNTQDEKNVVADNKHSITVYEYTANVMTGYKFTDKFSAKAEIAAAKGLLPTADKTGYGYFVELEYDTDWTFDSKADSSVYANVNHQDKYFLDGIGNDGVTTFETGMNFAFDNLTMTPKVIYEKYGKKTQIDLDGETTDDNIIVGFNIRYEI